MVKRKTKLYWVDFYYSKDSDIPYRSTYNVPYKEVLRLKREAKANGGRIEYEVFSNK